MNENIIELQDDEEAPISLTEKAIIAVKEVMATDEVEGDGLRIYVQGGGCSGLQYGLDFSDVRDGDLAMVFEGLNVYIDPISVMHLEGCSIDYVMGISGAGFKFNNPYAKSTCGCGSSFS